MCMRQEPTETAICTECGETARAGDEADMDAKDPCGASPDGLHTWTSDRFRALAAEALRVDGAELESSGPSATAVLCRRPGAAGEMLAAARRRGFDRASVEAMRDGFLVVVGK